MGKNLVIVESPAKARTINKYLGKDYIVKSSVGHVRDLPKSGNKKPVDAKARAKAAAETRKMSPDQKVIHKKKKAREQLIRRMGIDPDNGWVANYEILPGKEKVVSELKKLAKDADSIYLATDLDREGEAIAWHLRETIGGSEDRYRRVVFNEITKKAIQEAFKEPDELNLHRVQAQQARRFLDRVVGYMVSPLLWAKVARGLSAGRVQSVAVRLIVEREREIRSFIPEEYWEVYVETETDKKDFVRLQVVKQNGETFRPDNKESTDAALAILKKADYPIVKREDKPTRSRPSPPFITSTLQQAASTRLGFSVKKTMMLAQRLYEGGHITYMRTDSTNLSADAVAATREFIQEQYGEKYLPETAPSYSSKKGAQEAHEAIRASDVTVRPGMVPNIEDDAARLYDLIWRRFVACQMPPAQFLSTSVVVETNGFELRTRGRIMQFDGFMKVLPALTRKEDDAELPELNEGDLLNLKELVPSQHFTKPAPRYSEASLVKELEKQGIGRPSTYASIISTIQDRGYTKLVNRRFYAEKIGFVVTERLVENFNNLMDYGFTAGMEETLDEIAEGKTQWKNVLNNFYKDFTGKLQQAEAEKNGMRPNDPTDTDIECPNCSRPMQIRTASTGVFLGCSGYGLPTKERCKQTINLVSGDEVVSAEEDEEGESRRLLTKKHCSTCNTAMDSYLIDEQRKLHICGNNPDCSGFEVEPGHFKIKGYDGPIVECDKCGKDMQLKTGRFGKYFGCTNEECKNTRKLMRNGEVAPPRMDPVPMPELRCQKVDDHYLLRDGAGGLFLAASQFPRNREIRNPYVDELLPHKENIDPKYHHILAAPVTDGEGRRTLLRYSRKTKEQYIMTEENDKASGWSAYYTDGKWVERISRTAKKAEAGATRKKAAKKKTAKKKTTAKKTATKKTAAKKKTGKKTTAKKSSAPTPAAP